MLKRKARAEWQGTGLEGSGTLSTTSGALSETPYSFKTRFQNEDGRAGTNPEELIGAAHAGCFSMALSVQLSGAGRRPERIVTEATVMMDKVDGGFAIQRIHLKLDAEVPGIAPAEFERLAHQAKENCPVSKALASVPIDLEVNLGGHASAASPFTRGMDVAPG